MASVRRLTIDEFQQQGSSRWASEPRATRWLMIAVLGLLSCARPVEGVAVVQRLGRTPAAHTEPQAAKETARRSSRLVRSHVSHQAVAEVEEHSASKTAWPTKPHVVQIFYEALCPDSARLMSNRSHGLWASYNQKKDTYRFDLYPYGNAYKDHWNRTICQHGSEECKGNQLHQCALRVLNRTQAFALISCLMDSAGTAIKKYDEIRARIARGDDPETGLPNKGQYDLMQVGDKNPTHPYGDNTYHTWSYHDKKGEQREYVHYQEDVAEPCWKKLHQPRWKVLVEKCTADSEFSWNVLQYYAKETGRVKFSWVPAVFFNGTFNNEASHGADLLSYLDGGTPSQNGYMSLSAKAKK